MFGLAPDPFPPTLKRQVNVMMESPCDLQKHKEVFFDRGALGHILRKGTSVGHRFTAFRSCRTNMFLAGEKLETFFLWPSIFPSEFE